MSKLEKGECFTYIKEDIRSTQRGLKFWEIEAKSISGESAKEAAINPT